MKKARKKNDGFYRYKGKRVRCYAENTCGEFLKTKHFVSPDGYLFCNRNCYADDIEYDAEQDDEAKTRQGGADFFRALFGFAAAFGAAAGKARARELVSAIPPELYKKLIFLCHPDKHNNHPWAEEVTKWLLAEREKQKA